MDCLIKDLRELYERAKGYRQNQAPSPDYSTGRTDGFYEGVRYVFDKIAGQSNEPLTLEELRGMDGEPVWVCLPDGSHGGWMINYKGWCTNRFASTERYGTYGKSWIAYRHRPEEGAHP